MRDFAESKTMISNLRYISRITRIMVDLDDVFNNFTACAMRFLGCPPCEFPVECGYDIVAAMNLKHPTINNWVPWQIWGMLDDTLWEDMTTSDLHDTLLDHCVDIVGRDNVFICSTLTNNVSCTSGKLKWMQKHLPDWIQNQYVFTTKKYLLANKNTLLIDDYHGNTLAFEGAGGRAILVPRPWNPYNCYDTRSFVEGSLNYIRNSQK